MPEIVSKPANEAYRENYDRIFRRSDAAEACPECPGMISLSGTWGHCSWCSLHDYATCGPCQEEAEQGP